MHYEIRRGLKTGRRLTTAQRTSGTFAEEPIVLGKVMRRNSRPILLTAEQFEPQKAKLLRQLLSGSIEIFVVDEGQSPSRLDYKTARGHTPQPIIIPTPSASAGDVKTGSVPASEPVTEETEADALPPSSVSSEDAEPEEAVSQEKA